MQVCVMSGRDAPLARQNASFGSVDFLKLLDPGPNGEPLTFAEVLESNPDWAEQNADPGVVQANLLTPAQPLESSRNPGGGAEPVANNSAALSEAAVRSKGGEAEPTSDMLRSMPSLGASFGNTLLGGGFSGNFSQLVKHPSFSSQLSKDPSFGTAVFNSLLSQKSEDQAMLWSLLGVDPATGNPLPPSSSTANEPPNSAQGDLRNDAARNSSQDILLPPPSLHTYPIRPEVRRDQQSEGLPSHGATQLPDLSTRPLGPAAEMSGRAMTDANGLPLPDLSIRPLSHSSARPAPLSAALPMGPNLKPDAPVPAWPPPALEARLPPPLPRGPGSEYRLAGDSPATLSGSLNPGRVPVDLEAARAGSLDYYLQAPNTNRPPKGPVPSGSWLPPTGGPQRSDIALQVGGSGYRLPTGLARLEPPSFQPVPKRSDRTGGNMAQNPGRPFAPRASYPSLAHNVQPARGSDLGIARLPPGRMPQSSSLMPPKLPAAPPEFGYPPGGTTSRPLTQPAQAQPPPVEDLLPVNPNMAKQDTPPEGQTNPVDGAKQKSKFVTGLMKGISPMVKKEAQEAAKSKIPPSIRLPALPAMPQIKPLPPLPKLDTIDQFHRSLNSTAVRPQLGILPLHGLRPQQGPWASTSSLPEIPPLPSNVMQYNGQLPMYEHRGPPLPPTEQILSGSLQPLMPDLPARPNGDGAPPPMANLRLSKVRAASQGLPASSLDSRSNRKRGRMDDISSNPDASTSHGDGVLDSDQEAEGRKELRKAKNRASAAASRARREAYTASLEIEVARLQKLQQLYLQLLDGQESTEKAKPNVKKLSRQKSI